MVPRGLNKFSRLSPQSALPNNERGSSTSSLGPSFATVTEARIFPCQHKRHRLPGNFCPIHSFNEYDDGNALATHFTPHVRTNGLEPLGLQYYDEHDAYFVYDRRT